MVVAYSVEKQIIRFITYYRRATDAATALRGAAHISTLRKICLIAVLDALAKAIYPTRGDNRTRFTQLIERFGDWEHCRYISLPHLSELLRRSPDPGFEDIRSHQQ